MRAPDVTILEAGPLDDDTPTLRMSRDAFTESIVGVDLIDDVDGSALADLSRRSEEP
ncbi:MAG: hypothetical protein JNL79_31895 [Myxococcales bacterium]|nr:hypothetical protein [Myxococcales bacterium]